MMMFWERIIRTTLNEMHENLGFKITMRTMVKSRGKTPIQVVPLYLFFVHKKKKKKKNHYEAVYSYNDNLRQIGPDCHPEPLSQLAQKIGPLKLYQKIGESQLIESLGLPQDKPIKFCLCIFWSFQLPLNRIYFQWLPHLPL